MAVQHLVASVPREPAGPVLDLRGEINGFGQETLAATYAEAEKVDPEAIILNFEEVDYINSPGIALIVGLLAKACAAKRKLLAYGLSEHYVESLIITRLSDFVVVYSDEESALSKASVS